MKNKKLSPGLIRFGGRGFSIAALMFPFLEAVSYFAPKVFLTGDSVAMQMFFSTYIEKLSSFYVDNNLIFFIFMIWVYICMYAPI